MTSVYDDLGYKPYAESQREEDLDAAELKLGSGTSSPGCSTFASVCV